MNGSRPKRSDADRQFVLHQIKSRWPQAKQPIAMFCLLIFACLMVCCNSNPLPAVQGAQRVVAHDGVVTGSCISIVGLH